MINTVLDSAIDSPFTPLAQNRSRAFVKVQDGCRYRCTFCIVTSARGAERSRAVGDIVDEINQLHDQGVNEAVLTGVHLGGYGSDSGNSLTELIDAVLSDTDCGWGHWNRGSLATLFLRCLPIRDCYRICTCRYKAAAMPP